MANPDPENGHIDMANELAEELMKINISPNQYRVLWLIWRKTYGWHKENDFISLTQFEDYTNLDRRNIARAIKKFENLNMIKVTRQKGRNSYEFNSDYEQWNKKKTSVRKDTSVSTNTNSVSKPTPKIVSKKTPTKENKETIPKKSTKEVKEIFDYYDKNIHYLKKREQKHRAMITKCLKRFSVEELKMAIDGIANSEYYMKNRFFEMERIFLDYNRVKKWMMLYRKNREEIPWILPD